MNAVPPVPTPGPGPDTAAAGYEARLKVLEEERANDRRELRKSEINRQLDRLEPLVKFDRAREVAYLQDLEPAKVQEHLKYIADFHERKPNTEFLDVGYSAPLTPTAGNDPTVVTDEMRQARALALKHPGMSFEDALAKVKAK